MPLQPYTYNEQNALLHIGLASEIGILLHWAIFSPPGSIIRLISSSNSIQPTITETVFEETNKKIQLQPTQLINILM